MSHEQFYIPDCRDVTVKTPFTIIKEPYIIGYPGVRPYERWKAEVPTIQYVKGLGRLLREEEDRIKAFGLLLRDELIKQRLTWLLQYAGEDKYLARGALSYPEETKVKSVGALLRDEIVKVRGYGALQLDEMMRTLPISGRLLVPEETKVKAFWYPATQARLDRAVKKKRLSLIELILLFLEMSDEN